MTYQSVILADRPVAYWPLNETSGTTAHDLSGNGYNGTYVGGYNTRLTAQQIARHYMVGMIESGYLYTGGGTSAHFLLVEG